MTKIQDLPGFIPKGRPDLTKGAPAFVRSTYIIAFILLLAWMVGFLVFHAGNEIHVLLLLSMTAILTNIVREG